MVAGKVGEGVKVKVTGRVGVLVGTRGVLVGRKRVLVGMTMGVAMILVGGRVPVGSTSGSGVAAAGVDVNWGTGVDVGGKVDVAGKVGGSVGTTATPANVGTVWEPVSP